MKTIWNQMLGRESEPVWMSVVGVLAMFALPASMALWCVAMGIK